LIPDLATGALWRYAATIDTRPRLAVRFHPAKDRLVFTLICSPTSYLRPVFFTADAALFN